MTASVVDDKGRLDASRFAVEAERMTNEASLGEWLALYHHDAVAEWIIDGVRRCYTGIDEIRPAATVMAGLWRVHGLQVRKTVQCANSGTVVLTYEGGFRGRTNQFGTEIWTFRDGLVSRHQLYGYLDVRRPDSVRARLRMLLIDPRTALSALWNERKHYSNVTE
ncbi:nuclear transport factor 2 family protein [Nocardia transvalensis]|uniref:nuclear transport factor 2 family protein n=1 Tax=Nocardia transvalensis TaxID=37333 RepID=UPI0018944CEA|nr:hypothetical protein [Nocardia transvalensis]MBF6330615.1 hypothetical protein [Nocardia transvalensis]